MHISTLIDIDPRSIELSFYKMYMHTSTRLNDKTNWRMIDREYIGTPHHWTEPRVQRKVDHKTSDGAEISSFCCHQPHLH